MRRILETSDASFTIFSEQFNTSYHSIHGAIQESSIVYIDAGLKYFWHEHGSETPVRIFEMGFGSGLNAWLTYIHAKEVSAKVNYYAIEKFPLDSTIANLYNAKYQLHPDHVILENLHKLTWETTTRLGADFHISLSKQDFLLFDQLDPFDLMYYDAFGPSTQPELWDANAVSKMSQMMKSGGILVTFCAQGQFKRLLREFHFEVTALPGPKGKREITRAIRK
ncbi:MAG: tRNA (5-methylaminomethyl-2-thiouridine)(34)-methyltransferase MnmD [Saprospiraceae bacterium]